MASSSGISSVGCLAVWAFYLLEVKHLKCWTSNRLGNFIRDNTYHERYQIQNVATENKENKIERKTYPSDDDGANMFQSLANACMRH